MIQNQAFIIDKKLPRMTAIEVGKPYIIRVTWDDGRIETCDLDPMIRTFRRYAPLRADPDLFATAHIIDDGYALAWGDGSVEMGSVTVETMR